MKKNIILLCCIMLTSFYGYAGEIIKESKQLIVVVANDWSSFQGHMQLFERENVNQKWKKIGRIKPVVLGKKGFRLGKGLYKLPTKSEVKMKKEGDMTSPAGIFSLGASFGHTNRQHLKSVLKYPYLEITPTTVAVDDPKSRYYNQIIDKTKIEKPDWKSAEQMGLITLYLRGVVINHNTINVDKESGSQIFLHVWRTPESGTAGCTAVSPRDMDEIVKWLDSTKTPLLIQAPKDLLNKMQKSHDIPQVEL